MSFFTSLDKDFHTFAAYAENVLAKFEKDEPAIAKTTDSIIQYVGGAASVIAGLEGGPLASAGVNKLVGMVQTGVTALSGLVTDFGATPTAASMAKSLAENATSLLAAAEVKDPKSVIAGNAIISNLTALATALTTASGASTSPQPPTQEPAPAE